METVLITGVYIKLNKKENIKECISIYENDITFKPLNDDNNFKTHSSYIPLIVLDINTWFNKHFKAQ